MKHIAMWKRTNLTCAATLSLIVGAGNAVADEADNVGTPSTVGEIIVTAQRRAETLERTPVAVTALSAESLQKRAIVTESDLLTAAPGLNVKAGQSANQLNYSLRGQTVDSFSSSRPSVLPYINEVQVGGQASTAFYDLASIQVLKGPQGTLFGRNSTGGAVLLSTVKPTNEFEGYVTLRGGNYSHFQGEGAINVPLVDDTLLARVAGFVQRRDGFQFNRFNNKTVGDVRRESVRASVTFKPSSGLTNDLVVDYLHTGGSNISSVVYNVRPQNDAGAFVPNNIIYSPLMDAVFGAPGAWQAFLAAHPAADPQGIGAFVEKQRKRGPFDISVDAPNFHYSKRLFISNITSVEIGQDTQLRNILGYVWRRGNDASEFDGTPFPADDNGTQGRGGTLRQFSEEFQIVGKAADRQLSYVAGLYYTQDTDNTRSQSVILDLTPIASPINQINNGRTRSTTFAGYAEGTLDLAKIVGLQGLSFTAGARYSSEKVKFTHQGDDIFITNPNPAFVNPLQDTFNKFSWHLGLQYQATPGLLIYATSRRSFRSGGFNYFAPPLPGFGNNGGAEYKPETATDVEIGAKYRGDLAGMPIRFNLAAYKMWIEDIQRSNYVSILGSLAGITVNVPKSEIRGFELDTVINPADWLSIGGNLNHTDARFTSNLVSVLGNPAVAFGPYPDTPRWSAAAFAELNVPLSGALQGSLRGDVYSQTSSFFSSTGNTLNPGSQIPGYTLANFRVGIEDSAKGWSLAANLRNAFNQVYYVGGIGFSSLLALNTVIPGEPRTWTVEARYKF